MNKMGKPELNAVGPEQQGPHFDNQEQATPSFDMGELDLRDLLNTLWRRKMMIFSTVILITALTALTVLQITPRYTATTNVMLETRQNNVVDIESVMSGMSAEMATVLSEVEVIRSSSLIRRVVHKLNLIRDPEFNGELRKKPWYQEYLDLETYVSKEFLITVGLRKQKVMLAEEEARERLEAQVIEAIKGGLSVAPVRRSLVISISFTSENARKAALISNAIAEHYIVDQLEAKFEATRRATSWLNERIGALRDKVKKTEAAVEAYRSKTSGRIGQSSKMTDQQISDLNTQLILASTEKAEADARLQQVEQLLSAPGDDLNSAAEVLNSPLIQRLRDQEAQVLRKVSELSSRYGDRHPRMIKARAEYTDLGKSIEREVKKIAQSLRNEMQIARVRQNTLQQNLNRLELRSGKQGKAAIKFRELEREAQANRLLYENFLSRFKETSEQENLQQADTRIISRADVPLGASFPKKKLTVILAMVGSLFLAVVLVFVVERLDNSFRSSEQLENMTGIPVIGMVPLVTSLLGRKNVSRYLLDNPSSSVSESVRSLRTSLLLSNVDNPPKVIGVTSTVPSEGKSTIAMWLAQVAATSGQKVLLVDADLRRPSVHKNLNIDNSFSLVELLAEDCSLEQAVQKDEQSGVFILPGKSVQASALDMLSSNHMATFIQSFRQHFDLIIIDAPPILAVSDAKIIGQIADKMLYTVQWDSTPKKLVQAGLRAATDANIDLAGAVLTQVNTRKHARYGYGDYGYYYGKYKDYYTS